MTNPFLGKFNSIHRGAYQTALRPPNLSDAGFYWTGEFDGTDLVNRNGTNVPKVSGSGLDTIYDFSVLSDTRLNKNASINNVLALPEYYDPTFWTGIYFDVGNPYHAKLKDFHYRDIENQLATLSNIFFAQATYSGTVLQSIDSLVIYNTELETSNLSSALNYIKYQLPIPTFVTEDKARVTTKNSALSYTAGEVTAGSGGTYSTITAALAGVSNLGTIRVLSNMDMGLEPSEHFLINTVKDVLIIGDNSSITLDSLTGVAVQTIRIRQTGNLKFQDIKITGDKRYTIFDDSTDRVSSTCVGENCDIKNYSTNANAVVFKNSGVAAFDSFTEFIDCRLETNYGYIFIPSNVNNNGHIYLENCKSYMNTTTGLKSYWSVSTMKNYIYDCEFYQQKEAPIIQIAQDTTVSAIAQSCDIRNTKVKFLNGSTQHGFLIGRGVNDVYCVNNTSNGIKTDDILSIGFVIKSIGLSLSDCVFKGNYSKSLRPFLIKGGAYNDLQNNISVNNGTLVNSGYALELDNDDQEIPLNSNNNNVQYNKLYGKEASLLFTNEAGAEIIKTTANTCVYDNNNYFTYDQDVWAEMQAVGDVEFIDKANIWTGSNDVNSNWQRVVQQDAYINEF